MTLFVLLFLLIYKKSPKALFANKILFYLYLYYSYLFFIYH
nr:MAG TPA: hypothetical protein [Caudoviricetes sp.]